MAHLLGFLLVMSKKVRNKEQGRIPDLPVTFHYSRLTFNVLKDVM